MDGRERRRHPRYDTDDLEGRLVFSLDADVRNISLAGMAVESRTPFTVGKSYSIRLGTENDAVSLNALARWCQLARVLKNQSGEQDPVYEAGFSFDGILSEEARRLLRFLEQNVVVDVEERLFGRIQPRPGSTVSLQSEYEFQVKRISLSGMLIETSTPAEVGDTFGMRVELNGEQIETMGRIAAVVRPGVTGQRVHFQFGVEFQDLPDEGRTKLVEFIRRELERDEPPAPPSPAAD